MVEVGGHFSGGLPFLPRWLTVPQLCAGFCCESSRFTLHRVCIRGNIEREPEAEAEAEAGNSLDTLQRRAGPVKDFAIDDESSWCAQRMAQIPTRF